MISKQFTINEKCLDCNHLGYCQPYWGAACRRQGGTRLPRLKSTGIQLKLSEINLMKSQKRDSKNIPKKMKKVKPGLSQPIKTRPVNWDIT
jgi:hypothetical protein